MSGEASSSSSARKRRLEWQSSRTETLLDATWRRFADGDQKSATKALYQSAANLFVVMVVAVAFALYYVFSAFIRPLLWAVLCGTFLFPIKRRASRILLDWLRLLQANNMPICVGMCFFPLTMSGYLLTKLEDMLRNQWRYIVFAGVLFGGAYAVNNFPLFAVLETTLSSFLAACAVALNQIRQLGFLVWSLVIAYLLLVIFCWHSPALQPWLRTLSMPVWAVLLLYLAGSVGDSYRLPLFLLVAFLCIVGLVAGRRRRGHETAEGGSDYDEVDFHTDGSQGPFSSDPNSLKYRSVVSGHYRRRSTIVEYLGPSLQHSGIYFYTLLWSCIALKLFENLWLLPCFLVLLAIAFIRAMDSHFRLWNSLQKQLAHPMKVTWVWLTDRSGVLVPPPVRGLLRLFLNGDTKVKVWLEEFTSKFVTLLLIFGLVFLTLALVFLLAVQVRYESAHIVTQTTVVCNNALSNYPELQDWWQQHVGPRRNTAMNAVTQHAYMYGRQWIRSWLSNILLEGQDKRNISKLEEQLLEVWDDVYNVWSGNVSEADRAGSATKSNSTPLLKKVSSVQQELNMSSIVSVVKENLGAVESVLASTWAILQVNLNLLVAISTATLSILLSGSTAVLNFLVDMAIFLTSLMYLLAASDKQYIPLAWITSLFPAEGDTQQQASSAVSNAIRGVFGATLKMVIFYFFFTYFTHSLFGFEVVFTPAVVAAVVSAIPLLGTYWIALPAVLYLWLVAGSALRGLLILSLHFLSCYFVDVAIYSEIRGGGHPYLTGLAVAGGLYMLGLEGAVIGPILLCCGLVALNIYRNILNDNEGL